jgi:hypothetical protein
MITHKRPALALLALVALWTGGTMPHTVAAQNGEQRGSTRATAAFA